jgi:hypothetical protein
MATASERLWRTGDGRLVRDGDPDGEFLAYPAGSRIEAKDEHLVPSVEPEPKPARAKAAAKPADKQAAKPDDKQAETADNK